MISVITGATSGIGYETACGLAKKKHKLILVSRNIDKLNKVYNIWLSESEERLEKNHKEIRKIFKSLSN